MSAVPANGGVHTWRIEPAGPLRGDVPISGSKNVVTKLMVASLLSAEPGVVLNAPRISDVDITAGMLCSLGAEVDVDRASQTVTVDPANVVDSRIPLTYSGLNRVPILLTGPIRPATPRSSSTRSSSTLRRTRRRCRAGTSSSSAMH